MRANSYTYENIIYPLQNKVLSLFRDTPFYLTGGTALSRGYYNHRYSDDLDFFVNKHPDFEKLAEVQKEKLYKLIPDLTIDQTEKDRYRISSNIDIKNNLKLRIDIVNYYYMRIGDIVNHPVLGKIDSKENILSNKLIALTLRAEPKDIVDIYYLLKDNVSLEQALVDVRSKAAGISPLAISKILMCTNYDNLRGVVWIKPVSGDEIKKFYEKVTADLLEEQRKIDISNKDLITEQDQHIDHDIEPRGRHR